VGEEVGEGLSAGCVCGLWVRFGMEEVLSPAVAQLDIEPTPRLSCLL